ncbi:MAG: protein-L-isoaspartate(D-aspartate) O-methyltransferase [Bacteroidales bacterium]|nr:protein-L-isoaspartate(D-aspartate) O-methyltransferase [Bacteroidales bacterium]MBN2756567.1 protein-L-isoaspartate(D-aspartate) O-methyltransferase [Bacteroidales bacterium]
MQDTYKHKGQRKKLIEELSKQGIENKDVLNAMLKIPRHFFMDISFDGLAYKNKAFPIGAGQTISQPFTVAFQTQLLDIKANDKVLEVGTGSGYQTAVLIEMGAIVYTIERQKELFIKTQSVLPEMGYEAQFFYGDGYKGKPTYGPFDKIIVTAGAPYIPEELKSQLKIGGIMVIPIGDNNEQKMFSIVRISETEFKETEFGNFLFVPMLKGKQK